MEEPILDKGRVAENLQKECLCYFIISSTSLWRNQFTYDVIVCCLSFVISAEAFVSERYHVNCTVSSNFLLDKGRVAENLQKECVRYFIISSTSLWRNQFNLKWNIPFFVCVCFVLFWFFQQLYFDCQAVKLLLFLNHRSTF